MANDILSNAKKAKNDEFYTLYEDIQKEMNAYLDYNPDVFRDKTILLPCDDPEWSNFTKFFAQNFEKLGIKKLISTSYAASSKAKKYNQTVEDYHQITLFELNAPQFNQEKTDTHGKIFVLDRDNNNDNKIDIDDLTYDYLEGDGDYNSNEVKALRDEADFIITNPPFSKFREFVAWIMETDAQFAIIGNMNAITYKEIFPLIKENKIWLDNPFVRGAGYFTTPMELNKNLSYFNSHDYREGFIRVPGVRWYTNIETGRRHQPISLMSELDNIKFSRHKEIRDIGYSQYDNYNAIEVPFTDGIPSDFSGVIGVPISFIDKYCPEQFEILGITLGNTGDYPMTKVYENAIQHNKDGTVQGGSKVNTRAAILCKDKPQDTVFYTADNVDGYLLSIYPRVLIRKK